MVKQYRFYADFEDAWNRTRNHNAGKPIGRWGRLFKEGNTFVIRTSNQYYHGYVNKKVCEITPDNIITFVLPVKSLLAMSNSLSAVLMNYLPINLNRKTKGVYTLTHTGFPNNLPAEYFEGIKFSLISGNCPNRRPDLVDRVRPDKRSEWLRILKRYKKGLRIRIRMGVLDDHFQSVSDVNSMYTWTFNRRVNTVLEEAYTADWVYKDLASETYSDRMYSLIADCAVYAKGTSSMGMKHKIKGVDVLFDRLSLSLRKLHGVFYDEE